jgi:hypothetical protein
MCKHIRTTHGASLTCTFAHPALGVHCSSCCGVPCGRLAGMFPYNTRTVVTMLLPRPSQLSFCLHACAGCGDL